MFKIFPILRDPEPGQSGDGGSPSAPNGATPDQVQTQVDAAVKAALSKQQSDFNAQFKEATGHDDLKAYTEAQLKAQGKLQELADSHQQEAQTFRAKYEQVTISHALLAAGQSSVDPDTVVELLSSKASVDGDGAVSIEGKPVAEAVQALLDAKPFLAKPQGGPGSGAPGKTSGGASMTRSAFAALSPIEQAQFIRDGGSVV